MKETLSAFFEHKNFSSERSRSFVSIATHASKKEIIVTHPYYAYIDRSRDAELLKIID